MKSLTTYLTFDGTCSEAMTFYAKCLGAELQMMPFSEAPGSQRPSGDGDRIMHSRVIKSGTVVLMASDSMAGMAIRNGSNFSISVDCESEADIDSLFAAFSEGGTVRMPLAD